ncbi:MAG: hypothetical protein OXQ31_13975 [Spirochaetaceae bacterium]|nr:hypothetical protein [Spirochaetaceae bacterium]MDE2768575.1 hypothetical protein [Chloroflexota bacterium]
MKQETVAIVSVGVALLVALASFLLPLRGDVRMLSGEVRALAERVAKIEGQNEMALRLREVGQ